VRAKQPNTEETGWRGLVWAAAGAGLALHRQPVLTAVAGRESADLLLPTELRAALSGAREVVVAGATLRPGRP